MDAPPPPLRGPVLLIGHSYVAAIEQAWRERAERGGAAFQMRTISFVGLFKRMCETVNGEIRLNPEIPRVFHSALEETRPALIVGAFWGAQHFPLSTVNNPRPFDFLLPGDPAGAASESGELVPFDLIERFLRVQFADARLMTAAMLTQARAPLLLLPAPPPLRDFVGLTRGTTDRVIDAEVARHGVAPPSLRRKVWRACEAIYRAIAAEAGVPVAPTPPGVADAEGFRLRSYCSQDWIHANSAWGDLILDQIEGALAGGAVR
jgi:hypothetical protein